MVNFVNFDNSLMTYEGFLAPENSSEKSNEAQLQEIKEYWMGRAKQLHQEDYTLFTSRIHSLACRIQTRLMSMSASHAPNDFIRLEMDRELRSFHQTCSVFYQNRIDFQVSQLKVKSSLDDFGSKLSNSSGDFSSFICPPSSKPKTAKDFLDEDPFWALKRSHIEENIAMAEMVSGALEVIGIPIGIAVDGVKAVANAVCNTNDTTQNVCKKIGEIFDAGLEKAGINAVQAAHEKAKTNLSLMLEQEYQIPKEIGEQYVENTANAALGLTFGGASFGLSKGVAKAAGKLKGKGVSDTVKPFIVNQPIEISRYDYSKKYHRCGSSFINPPKEFEGILSRELLLVSYHSDLSLGSSHLFRWSVPAYHANKMFSMEDVFDQLALLSKFGEKTHVSVARIPAGEQVKFKHGRASPQVDLQANECRTGGGVQYCFYDFDPKWIAGTRELPKSKTPPDIDIKKTKPFLEFNKLDLPSDFPKHLNQFFSDANVFQFTIKNIGRNGNGVLSGNLLYQHTSDEGVLFLIQNRTSSFAALEKLQNKNMINAANLFAHERLSAALDSIINFAKEQGLQRVYITWNPEHYAVVSAMETRIEKIVSMGTFSAGIHAKPMQLVEIKLGH